MSAKDHGGPAFPVPLNKGEGWQGMAPCDGMTLRDYFAAKAMQAGLTGATLPGLDSGNPAAVEAVQRAAAAFYVIADAMLEARQQ